MLRILQAGLPVALWQPSVRTACSAWSLCVSNQSSRWNWVACNRDRSSSRENSPPQKQLPTAQACTISQLSHTVAAPNCSTTRSARAVNSKDSVPRPQQLPGLSRLSRSYVHQLSRKPGNIPCLSPAATLPKVLVSDAHRCYGMKVPHATPCRLYCTRPSLQPTQSPGQGQDKATFTRPGGKPLPPQVTAVLPRLLELLIETGMTHGEADAVMRACLKPVSHRGWVGWTEQNWKTWISYFNLHAAGAASVLCRYPYAFSFVLDTVSADGVLKVVAGELGASPDDVCVMLTKHPLLIAWPAASVATAVSYMLHQLKWSQASVLRLAKSAPSVLTRNPASLQRTVDWLLSKGFDMADVYRLFLGGKVFTVSIDRRLEPMHEYITSTLAQYIKDQDQLEGSVRLCLKGSVRLCLKRNARLLTANVLSTCIQSRAAFWHEQLRASYADKPWSLALVLKHDLLRRTGPRFALLQALGIARPKDIFHVLFAGNSKFVEAVAAACESRQGMHPDRRISSRRVIASMLQTALAHPDSAPVVALLSQQPGSQEIRKVLSAKMMRPDKAMSVFIRVWQASEEGRKYIQLASNCTAGKFA